MSPAYSELLAWDTAPAFLFLAPNRTARTSEGWVASSPAKTSPVEPSRDRYSPSRIVLPATESVRFL